MLLVPPQCRIPDTKASGGRVGAPSQDGFVERIGLAFPDEARVLTAEFVLRLIENDPASVPKEGDKAFNMVVIRRHHRWGGCTEH